jgi:hypothetical protein
VVIYMEERVEARSTPMAWPKEGAYADEIMYANWNPEVQNMTRETLRAAPGPELLDNLSKVDVNAILDRFYALATLI